MVRKVAVLASGDGTNAENIIRYFAGNQQINVGLVLTNRMNAKVLERARALGVPCAYFSKELWAEGTGVLSFMQTQGIDFVVLAGFLLRIPDVLLDAYRGRMVNIHPSLLPKFGGKGMYGDRIHAAVVEAGEQESGITIHYTSSRYDEGEVIAQYRCEVLPADTPQTLAQRIHALEYKHYPEVIARLLTAQQ